MAHDLIPPPSPAGTPTVPGGTPRLIELPPEPPRSGAEPAQRERPTGPSQYRNRFGFVLGSLVGVCVAAALIVAAVLITNGGDPAAREGLAKNWSKWQPHDSSIQGGSAEIAEKVGAEYKQSDGKQLLLVEPNPVDNLHVAIKGSSIPVLSGTGVVYNLNGLGPNGSIKGGTPSAERMHVIQREALELALYSFRYLPDVDMVVTLLPPAPPSDDAATASNCQLDPTGTGCPQQRAVFYRPGDLKQQLQVPLGVTVPAKAPTPDTLDATEAKQIDSLTLSNLFLWSLQPNSGLLVLDRP